ncbi:30S ribosomal protein S6 [Bienertia sinuspersici]
MKTYKGYVKNAYRPEGCIAERNFFEEAIEYCNKYLKNVKTIGIPVSRHSGRISGKGTIGKKQFDLSHNKWHMAHTYILHNEEEVAPYVEKHMTHLRKTRRKENEKSLANEHNKSFWYWFKNQVMNELENSPDSVSDRLKSLAYGPNYNASSYTGYVINGYTFYTRSQDDNSTMQNSGVTLEAETMHFSSAKDKHPVYSKMQYYGVIEEIYELHYYGFSIPIFGCSWVDNNYVVSDKLGCTLVNLTKLGHKEDPFILASQAKQVFYMVDPSDKRMSAVITPRSRLAIDDFDGDVVFEQRTRNKDIEFEVDIGDDTSIYVREDHDEGIWIEEKSTKGKRAKKRRRISSS